MAWTEQHDELLRQSRKNNLSFAACATTINRAFHAAYSKNACIARAHRIGLPENAARAISAIDRETKRKTAKNPVCMFAGAKRKNTKVPQDAPANTAPVCRKPYRPAMSTAPLSESPDQPLPEPSLDKPIGTFGLLDLRNGHCRFPHGEAAPFLFCGAVQADGYPYCAEHVAVTHNPEGRR